MNFNEEIYDKFYSSRLSIKKKNVRFLELLFRYNGIDIEHDNIIKIAYNFREPRTSDEQKFKNFLLTYEYVIGSNKNNIDIEYLKKIYYLCDGKELANNKAVAIQSAYYEINNNSAIEKAILFHYFLYHIFEDDNLILKNILPLIFLTRELLNEGLSTFKISEYQYNEYLTAKQIFFETNNIIPTFMLLEKIYSEEKVQPIEYLENSKPLTIKSIKNAIVSISNLLDNYGVTEITIFGSFSKNMQRLDSDIDLYINVIDDVSYKEKEKRITVIKEILFSKLGRYIDIHELSYPIMTKLINEIKCGKLIYRKEEKNE